jgi:hypothetical protein
MTVSHEPPLVDLHDILDEQEAEAARPSGAQWLLLIGAGAAGIAGLLAVLVTTAPALLDLVSWIDSIQKAVNG